MILFLSRIKVSCYWVEQWLQIKSSEKTYSFIRRRIIQGILLEEKFAKCLRSFENKFGKGTIWLNNFDQNWNNRKLNRCQAFSITLSRFRVNVENVVILSLRILEKLELRIDMPIQKIISDVMAFSKNSLVFQGGKLWKKCSKDYFCGIFLNLRSLDLESIRKHCYRHSFLAVMLQLIPEAWN